MPLCEEFGMVLLRNFLGMFWGFSGDFLEENVQNTTALGEEGLEANNLCCLPNFRLQ